MPKRPVSATHERDEAMMTGLIRRGARYALRRRVPLDLVDRFDGRKEITRALGTSDAAEAKRRLVVEWQKLDHEFEKARASLTPIQAQAPVVPSPVEQLSPTLVSIINLDRLRDDRDAAENQGRLATFMQQQRDALALVQAMLNGSVAPTKPMRELEGLRNGLAAFLDGTGAIQLSAARRALEARPPATKAAPLPLDELRQLWAKEQKPEARTNKRAANVIARFEAASATSDARQITRAHVMQFKASLAARGSSPANINAMLNLFKAVLSYGLRNDLIKSNPASGISAIDRRRARDKRRNFSPEELTVLFAGPVHAQGFRPKGGGGEAAYWLPLLGLYTGARLNELGQLHKVDVLKEAYYLASGERCEALVMQIKEDAQLGQRLKNDASRRRIPVHPVLLELGFDAYISSFANDRLFPDIRPSAEGELTATWSKWFSRYRKSIPGLGGADIPFHAFRHSFKHFARDSSIAKEVSDALTGHKTGDVAENYGGLNYPLLPLVEGIGRYRVPGLSLPPAWSGAKSNHRQK